MFSASRLGTFPSPVAVGSSRLTASRPEASNINFYFYRCRPWWRDTGQSAKLWLVDHRGFNPMAPLHSDGCIKEKRLKIKNQITRNLGTQTHPDSAFQLSATTIEEQGILGGVRLS